MSAKPACQALADELTEVVDKYAENCQVSFAEAIGALELVKAGVILAAQQDTKDEP